MKQLSIHLLLGIIALTSFVACAMDYWPKKYPFLRFVNRSGINVEVLISTEYPDTLIHDWGGKTCLSQDTTELTTHFPLDELFEQNSVIQLIVFDYYHIREHISGEAITFLDSLNRNILRRYELTREWLDEHDWTVVYP